MGPSRIFPRVFRKRRTGARADCPNIGGGGAGIRDGWSFYFIGMFRSVHMGVVSGSEHLTGTTP